MIMLTDKARKVLALALDASAAEGEWQSAATMFFGLLRKEGVTFETIMQTVPEPDPQGYEIMTFGKFKGRHIRSVPLEYLRYAIANFQNLSQEVRNRMIFEVQNRRS